MARELKDKTVAVTGGAQGLGVAIANKFLKRDANVVILIDVDEKLGTALVQALNAKHGSDRAVFFKCDVATNLEGAVEKVIKQYNVIDILVNIAGIVNEANEKKTVGIDARTLMVWSVKLFEHMRKDLGGNGGTIINIASVCGYKADQFLPMYKRLKFSVVGFTRSFGHKNRCQRFGVHCVALCPTFMELMKNTKVKIIEDSTFSDYYLKTSSQKLDSAATITVNIFETADSGTVWLSEDSRNIVEIK